MPTITDSAGYWDHYAGGVADRDQAPEDVPCNAFGWTQYDGHGPGAELLGDPTTAFELGFGSGGAIAALAMGGVRATGVDISAAQVEHARSRWGHLPDAHFEHGDVVEFLAAADQRWGAIYSIWGALWFTDPEKLLPVVYDRLAPGGRLVFSQAPAVPGSYGIQGMYGNGFNGRQVWVCRWPTNRAPGLASPGPGEAGRDALPFRSRAQVWSRAVTILRMGSCRLSGSRSPE